MGTKEDKSPQENNSESKKIKAIRDLAKVVPDEDKLVVILIVIIFLIFSGSVVLLIVRNDLWWFPLIFLISVLAIYAFHIINKKSKDSI